MASLYLWSVCKMIIHNTFYEEDYNTCTSTYSGCNIMFTRNGLTIVIESKCFFLINVEGDRKLKLNLLE